MIEKSKIRKRERESGKDIYIKEMKKKMYKMSKKSWLILNGKLPYKMGQDFREIREREAEKKRETE